MKRLKQSFVEIFGRRRQAVVSQFRLSDQENTRVLLEDDDKWFNWLFSLEENLKSLQSICGREGQMNSKTLWQTNGSDGWWLLGIGMARRRRATWAFIVRRVCVRVTRLNQIFVSAEDQKFTSWSLPVSVHCSMQVVYSQFVTACLMKTAVCCHYKQGWWELTNNWQIIGKMLNIRSDN